MDEQELRRLLRSDQGFRKRRGWRCPDENQLTGYVSGRLGEKTRATLDTHFAGCDSCRSTIAFLVQSAEWPDAEPAPTRLVSRARTLVKTRGTVWRWRWAMATAAVACAVILVGLISWQLRKNATQNPDTSTFVAQQREPEHYITQSSPETAQPALPRAIPKPKPTETLAPTVRGGADLLAPALVSPREGELLKADKLAFTWKPVENAVSYEVKVADLQGGSILSGSTTVSHLNPGDTAQLSPGKYFVTIVAHLRDSRTVRSKLVSFRIAP